MHGYETDKKASRACNVYDKDPAKAMHNRSRNHTDLRVPRDEFENLQIGGYDDDASSVSSLSHVSGKFAKREKREKKKGLLRKIVKSVAKSASRKSSSNNRHEDGVDYRKVIRRNSINTAIETDEGYFGTSGHDADQDYHTHDSISRVTGNKKTSVASRSSYEEDSISSLDSAIEQAKSRNAGVKPSSRSHTYQKRELVGERRKTSRKRGFQSNELSRDKNKEEQKKIYTTSHYYQDDESFNSFESKDDDANSKRDNIYGDNEDKKKTYSTRMDFQDDSSYISFISKDDRVNSKKKSPHGTQLKEKNSSRSSRHQKVVSEVEDQKRSRRRRPQDIEANEKSTEEREKTSIASRHDVSDNDSLSSSGSYLEDTHSRTKSMHDDKSRCSEDSDKHAKYSKPRSHSNHKVEQDDDDKRRSCGRNHQDNESKRRSSRKCKAVDSCELQPSNNLQEHGDTKATSTESPGLDKTIKGRSLTSPQNYRSQSDGSLRIETKARSQIDDESKNDDKKSRGRCHKNKISLESFPKNVSVSDRGPRSLYPESSSNKKLRRKKSGSNLGKDEVSREISGQQGSDQKPAEIFTSFKSTPHISEQYFRSSQGKLEDDDKSYDYYLRDDSKEVEEQPVARGSDQGRKSKKAKEEEHCRRDSLKSLSRYIRAEKERKYAKSKEPAPTHCKITPSSNKGVGTIGRKTKPRRPFPAGDDPHLITVSIKENKHKRNHQLSDSTAIRGRASSSRESKSRSSKTSQDMYYDGKNSSSKKKHHHSSSSGRRLSSDHNKEHIAKSKSSSSRSTNKEDASSQKDITSDTGKPHQDKHESSSEGPELSATRQRALRRSSSKKSLDDTKEDLDVSEATMNSNRGRRSNKKENEVIDISKTGTTANRSVSSSKTSSSKRAGKKAEYLSNLFDNSKSSTSQKEEISLVRDEERKSSDHLNDLFKKKKTIPLKHHQYGRR